MHAYTPISFKYIHTHIHAYMHACTLKCNQIRTSTHARTHARTHAHYTALHCTALHCTALHCTALHYTALLQYTSKTCDLGTVPYDVYLIGRVRIILQCLLVFNKYSPDDTCNILINDYSTIFCWVVKKIMGKQHWYVAVIKASTRWLATLPWSNCCAN